MYVLIEEEAYPLDLLESIFDDASFYHLNKSSEGIIKTVGYYYSDTKRTLVYMLPKVFMRDDGKTVFQLDKMDLANIHYSESFTFDSRYQWVRQLAIYFYNSLKEFKRRHLQTTLVSKSSHTLLNSNIPQHEYSYLDLVLTFVNFYQKNKNTILYRHIQSISKTSRRTSWDKTVRKQTPIINSSNQPIYDRYLNKKKVVNFQEELTVYFFSILNRLNEEHGLNIKIDRSYTIVRGSAFEFLKSNGLNKLRKIKYRYFSDVYKKMYRLCELYFTNNDLGAKSYKNHEFITVDNYNIIFEDMIDKLFSDPIHEGLNIERENRLSLRDLKNHPDGKIIDHIYADKSLIDDSNIFYIGDSKYYKASGKADKGSQFKQFTYAKNVIQFHIDILNEESELSHKLRYRDEVTEGYNITPNFFIYAYIDDYSNFEDSLLEPRADKPIKSSHFPDRLFDRDTLFIHEYQINFLYVLKSYTVSNNRTLSNFREKSKEQFREKFLSFFNDPKSSGFIVIEEVFDSLEHLKNYVDENFKHLNGKCISVGNRLLVAKPYNDDLKKIKEREVYRFR